MQFHKLRVVHLRPPLSGVRLEMAGPITGSTKKSRHRNSTAGTASTESITPLVKPSAMQQAPVLMLTPLQH
jgi:hypothetical protein